MAEPYEVWSINHIQAITTNDIFINYLVGYYKNQNHLKWILENKMYNVPLDKRQGSKGSNQFYKDAEILILYGPKDRKDNKVKFRLFLLKNPRDIMGKNLNDLGYPNAKNDNLYGLYDLKELIDYNSEKYNKILEEVKSKLGQRYRKPVFIVPEDKMKGVDFVS